MLAFWNAAVPFVGSGCTASAAGDLGNSSELGGEGRACRRGTRPVKKNVTIVHVLGHASGRAASECRGRAATMGWMILLSFSVVLRVLHRMNKSFVLPVLPVLRRQPAACCVGYPHPRAACTNQTRRKAPIRLQSARIGWLSVACLLVGLGSFQGGLSARVTRGAELQYPISIVVAQDGTVYLADRNLPGIFRGSEGKLTVLFQASKRFRTPLNAVRCVALDRDGKLLAGDSAARNLFRFDESGKPVPVTKETGGLGQIGIPMSIAVDSQGTLFVSDLEIQRIVKIPAGSDQPVEVAEIAGCRGLCIDSQDRLWVVSTTQNQLHRIGPDGKKEVIVAGRPFEFPHTVVVASDGTAYVCDGYAKAIWKVVEGSAPTKLVEGAPFQNPVGMTLQGDRLWIADPRVPGVFQVDFAGQITPLPLKSADD